jgi:hypothetical protein
LATLFKIKADLLTVIQRAQAGLFDGGDVDKDILTAVLRLDEAEALLGIKPFDSADGHEFAPDGIETRRWSITAQHHPPTRTEFNHHRTFRVKALIPIKLLQDRRLPSNGGIVGQENDCVAGGDLFCADHPTYLRDWRCMSMCWS